MQSTAPRDAFGVVLKISFFAFIAVVGTYVFGWALSFAGLLVAAALGTFLTAAIANTVAVSVFERGSLADIGLAWQPLSGRNLVIGTGAGIVAAALVTLLPVAMGLAYFERNSEPTGGLASAAFVTIMLLFGAAGEEMLFRGYLFQLLLASIGTWPTLMLTSFLFGVVHMSNLNVSRLALANTIAFGVVLGYAYIRSRDLWLPIGLHFGWNWMLPLVGVSLSGFKLNVTGYELRWRLPDVWSGGEYGPEGGVLCWGVIVGLLILIHRAPVSRQQPVWWSPQSAEEA